MNILQDQSKYKYKKTEYSSSKVEQFMKKAKISEFERSSDLTPSRLIPVKNEPNLQALRMMTPMEKVYPEKRETREQHNLKKEKHENNISIS